MFKASRHGNVSYGTVKYGTVIYNTVKFGTVIALLSFVNLIVVNFNFIKNLFLIKTLRYLLLYLQLRYHKYMVTTC